jgi:hypothetical protein
LRASTVFSLVRQQVEVTVMVVARGKCQALIWVQANTTFTFDT